MATPGKRHKNICPKCGSDEVMREYTPFSMRGASIKDIDYEKGAITQRGVDPTKKYETIHDKATGETI